MNNSVGWLEIPVSDTNRAIRFYEEALVFKLKHMPRAGLDKAGFSWNQEGQGAPGSSVCNPEFCKLSADGVLIYLSSSAGDLSI